MNSCRFAEDGVFFRLWYFLLCFHLRYKVQIFCPFSKVPSFLLIWFVLGFIYAIAMFSTLWFVCLIHFDLMFDMTHLLWASIMTRWIFVCYLVILVFETFDTSKVHLVLVIRCEDFLIISWKCFEEKLFFLKWCLWNMRHHF